MIRAISILGLAGAFVIISPSIRGCLEDLGLGAQAYLTAHSPYSWVAVGGAALFAIMLAARSMQAPR
jgi:hypothetical protein